MPESFAELLGHFVQRSHYSAGQVAALSGMPKRTIANWLGSVVLKPQKWQGIVKVAAALKLSEAETSQLLTAAGHPPITELRQLTMGDNRELLLPWPQPKSAPFQAIADLPYFVGRDQALREVGDVLLQGQHVAICNLHGMGGVGKTSLAAHLAYQLRPFFPDGILWARLDTSDTLSILRAFAGAYGKDVSSYHDLDSCAGAVRSILADKQALIVLDNAEKSEQVRPLLPPTTGKTAVLITTRHDLAVADSMVRFPVETFDPASGESLALFVSFLGQDVVQKWRETLQNVADLLGHLPLAVAIAAGRLANGRVSIPKFLEQLQQAEQRLDVLVREDRSVRLSFDLSYQALSSEMQHFFAALGAFGGDDFTLDAAAYVTHVTPANAWKILDRLVHLSLVQNSVSGRYDLHPLLRDYARSQITSVNIYIDMVTFYIEMAQSIKDEDYKLLAPETSNIFAALKSAAERQLHQTLLQGIKAFGPYFYSQGLLGWQDHLLEQAKHSAYYLEDTVALVDILNGYGKLQAERGFLVKAESYFMDALALLEADNHKQKTLHSQCDILINLGAVATQTDRAKAERYYLEGRKIARKIDYDEAQIRVAINLGAIAYATGDHEQAVAYHLEALPLARQMDAYHLLILCLVNLCEMAWIQDDYILAERYLDEAEALARENGHYMHLIGILVNRSHIADRKGDSVGCERFLNEAAEISRKTDHLRSLAKILAGIGDKSRQRRDYNLAQSCLSEALSLVRDLSMPKLSCQVLCAWGELHFVQDDWQNAIKVWSEVLEISLQLNFYDYLVSAYYGLARVAEVQSNKDLLICYTENWQTIYSEMNQFERKKLKHWLPHLPVEV